MDIATTKFATVQIEPEDVLDFPSGLIGLDGSRKWVLLADGESDVLGWLQSTQRPDLALAVVSPRRFVPDYRARVYRRELEPLQLRCASDAQILVILSQHDETITLNLKAPLVINLERRLGRQVIVNDDQPVRHVVDGASVSLKKTA
ncbi:MAG: flagellar assembly protein FliW [Planctomycetes bacterium]|nr:flagellar assembly protein FliW [Planctomycetota bacterium]